MAQPRVEARLQANKTVDFYLVNKTNPGTLTAYLTLKDLHNCNAVMGTTKYETLYATTRLVSLRPVDETSGVGYGLSTRFFYGPVDKPVDTTFVYRMPTTVRWPARVARGVSVYDRIRKEKEGALGLHFEMEKGDTVYAMRRGIVVKIEIPAKRSSDDPAVSFTTNSTGLTIEHPDGSLAWYVCLDPDGFLVGEGDEVLPGTPLGLAGSYDDEHYKVAVQNFWWVTNSNPTEQATKPFVRKRFFPQFATADGVVCIEKGVYQPVETEELVTREMTKKEIKKRYGAKK